MSFMFVPKAISDLYLREEGIVTTYSILQFCYLTVQALLLFVVLLRLSLSSSD